MAWFTPPWPAPGQVRALSTWRSGGVSQGPFASFNLAAHVGDSAAAVAANRQALRRDAGLPAEPAWLAQVHGIRVLELDSGITGAETPPSADAAVSRRPGQVCAILTADCLPVLFAAHDGRVVGAAHAGWRGLAAGIVEATVSAMRVSPGDITAWLGPAIGPDHFEVGAEVRDVFLQADPAAGEAFIPNARGRFMADLWTLARRRLARLGITDVHGGGECTFSDEPRFFSHRRDAVSGRQASLIWIE